MDNNKKIELLLNIMNEGNVSKKEIESFVIAISEVVKKLKESVDSQTQKTTEEISRIIDTFDTDITSIKDTLSSGINETNLTKKEIANLNKQISSISEELNKLKSIEVPELDKESLLEEFLSKIVFPETEKIEQEPIEELIGKINDLPIEEDLQIDASHIKNLPITKKGYSPTVIGNATDLNQSARADGYAIVWDDTNKNFKFAAGGSGGGPTLQTNGTPNGSQSLLNLKQGTNVTITDDGVGGITIASTGGGGGTPGGSTTQLQYNNAGAFGGISGATTNGTAVTYTTGNLIGADVKASGSGGLEILSNAGTVTALFGAGGGANSTFYGGSKFDYATASTIAVFDGSKNLISADTATYPSLTELSYVKGVTSAIQTQLNGKANTSGALTQFLGNGNWKVWYSDGSGDVQELALGSSGTYLKSNGASSAPSFDTPSGGSGVDYGSPTYTVWQQDFISSSWSSTDSPFTQRNSGAGSGVGGPTTGKLDNTHYGYIIPATGTTTTGFGGFSTTDNTTALEPASGNIDFTVVIKTGTLSDATDTYLLKFGISDSNTGLGNNSINIAYSHGTNSGAWYLQMNTGGSSRATINSSTTVAANTWYTLRFTMTGTGQDLELFINGASAGTATPSATFATGTGVGIVNTIVKSAGTTSRNYTHDYIRCIQTVNR